MIRLKLSSPGEVGNLLDRQAYEKHCDAEEQQH